MHLRLFSTGLLFFVTTGLALVGSLNGEVTVAGIFGNNMVLQRGMENPIWGWSDPDDEITVQARDLKLATKAGSDGKWMVKLPAMNIGDPFSIVIRGSDNELKLENVLVGEVWICSGQSNMEWPVSGAANPQEEIANANYPLIRHVKVDRNVSIRPIKDCQTTGWQICSPDNAAKFTAVGYYFGRKLHSELNLPIGLINTTWGGTPVEAWTSTESIKTHPDYFEPMKRIAARADKIESATQTFAIEMKAWRDKFNAIIEQADQASSADAGDENWKTIQAPGRWEMQGYRNFDGVAWYRRTVEIPNSMLNKELEISLGMVDDHDRTFVNGQLVGSTKGWNLKRKYKVPGEFNNQTQLNIAVQVVDHSGGGGICGEQNQLKVSAVGQDPVSLAGQWQFKKSDKMMSLPPQPKNPGFRRPHNPTALFNAMVNPIVPVACKGVIWYQGESNAGRAYQYRSLFPLMIKDWRNKWDRDLPFYWVQLANFLKPSEQPGNSNWAELREAQSMALSLPKTGEAVIIDIGEARDIHPKNKQDVGKRLAWIALKNNYGFEIECSGPRYREMQIDGASIRLSFDHAQGLRSADGKPLSRFEIAGQDQQFVWAQARIDGQQVVVSSPDIENPVAVRYAWADNPAGCNLTNRIELPASPFRTDDWPGATMNSK